MRRLFLTVPVLAAGLACTTHGSVPDPRPEAQAARRLPARDALAGQPLTTAGDGPWSLRTTRAGGAEAHARAPAEKLALSAMEAGAGGHDLGYGGGAGGAFDTSAGEILDEATESAAAPPVATSPAAPAPKPPDGGDAYAETAAKKPRSEPRESSVDGPALAFEHGAPVAPTRELKAGSTDDNADHAAYLEFLATWVERKEIQELYQPLDVSDRRFLRIVDADGRPVPGAVVSVVDEVADRVLWSGTTYGDGRVPYYPRLGAAPAAVDDARALLIEAYVRDADGTPRGVRAPWDGAGAEVAVALPDAFRLPEPLQLDVCFVIDTTGSMGDEIESIKASLLKVTEQLRSLGREFDLRYSAVLYRDIGDAYVTATHAFTADIEAFDAALRDVRADGGGDGPESLNQAVAEAVDGVDWREGAAKVAFLIADAPPHMDYAGDVPYGESARAALARGIRIHAVAASGLDPVGTLVFRQIAQLTRGKFVFIEYGTPAESAASHGVAGAVKHDNLEDILFEQIRDELATYGR